MSEEIVIKIDIRNNENGYYDIHKEAELQLDEKCHNCDYKPIDEVCKYCKGTGYILTDAGEQIFKFISRHK